MPRTETILRVFIASPDDVNEEREILEDVIRELNIIHSKSIGIRFDPIKWETNTYPSIDTDVQAGISDQIGDDYDVFVGIMWKKLGTPTPRAKSGTVEEFELAHQRYLKDKDSVKILFYFKDAPISNVDVDPYQLILINEFRDRLKEIGVSFRYFNGRDEFEKLIRMNLSLLVQDWAKKLTTDGLQRIQAAETIQTSHDEVVENTELEEEGFLDLIEIGEERFVDVRRIAERIGEAIKILGDKATVMGEEIGKAKTQSLYKY